MPDRSREQLIENLRRHVFKWLLIGFISLGTPILLIFSLWLAGNFRDPDSSQAISLLLAILISFVGFGLALYRALYLHQLIQKLEKRDER